MTGADRHYKASIARLASMLGVQTSYMDASGVRREASIDSLARVLTGLGAAAGTEKQASASEQRLMAESLARRIEPVVVAWRGRRSAVRFSVRPGSRAAWTLHLEDGTVIEGKADTAGLSRTARKGPLGERLPEFVLPLPASLPLGYHRLTIDQGGERLETFVIAAPVRSFRHEPGVYEREWGVFCPAYALRSRSGAGCGTFSDLRELARWSESLGGRVVATLPLLASFAGNRPGPNDPSPYAPVSRLFWNELFIDPSRTPEYATCEAAWRLAESSAFVREAGALARDPLVNYPKCANLRQRVLGLLAEHFFTQRGDKGQSFRAFLAERPLASQYAAFRACTEKQGSAWGEWAGRARRGVIKPEDYDVRDHRYHLYAQYAAWLEMLALGAELHGSGGLFYLDLPVGVSPFGFDTWKWQGLFAPCSTGAPPDPYFTGGQNWGFPPLRPDACREEGYEYFRMCLQAHMRHADYLRLDHVMAFYRLFWIPDGMSAADGVYVRYPADEFFAILNIESHRYRCRLVGENLGTVPPEVNAALEKHNLCGLYVAQYEMQPRSPALRPVPANCVASVNTHDMPTFATTWSAGDVDDRIGLGLLDPKARSKERATRERMKKSLVAFLRSQKLLKRGAVQVADVRDALLAYLARSDADFVLINLEDLWLETHWQNVPGTMNEHPNWRRKTRCALDEIARDERVAALLMRIDALRRGRPTPTRGAKKKRVKRAGR